MSRVKLKRGELQHLKYVARLCESHTADAERCREKRMPGARLVHDSLAREYSREAFALAARAAARAAA